jgi:hypothetical protein
MFFYAHLNAREGGTHDESLVHFDRLVRGSGHRIFMNVLKDVWRKVFVERGWDDFG